MALSISGGKWQLKYPYGVPSIPVVNNISGGATDIAAGTAFHIASGLMVKCVDSNTVGIHGVVVDDIAAGAKGAAYISGVFRVGVSGSINFAIFAAAYTTTSGLIDEGSASDIEVGRVVAGTSEIEPAAADAQVDVLMRSNFLHLALLTHA